MHNGGQLELPPMTQTRSTRGSRRVHLDYHKRRDEDLPSNLPLTTVWILLGRRHHRQRLMYLVSRLHP